MSVNSGIGVKGWRNYSSFSLFGSGSQRSDRNTSFLVDTYSGNLSVLAVDWNLAARVACSLARAYNHQDSITGVDRPFGPGWYWQWDMNITGALDGSGTVTWKAADGSEYDFTSPTGSSSSKTYTSPAGMSKYKLSWAQGTGGANDTFTLAIGRTKYYFEVNSTDGVARLTKVKDAFTNAIVIDRVISGGKPTEKINYLQVQYYNGSSPWPTHNIVEVSYKSGTSLIEKLRLLDTYDSTNYIDLWYTYSSIDSADRLTQFEPKRGSTALNLELKYDYNSTSGKGLEMTKAYDSLGAQAGSPYYWQFTYSGSPSKVATVVFPIDGTPTTGTVAYAYNQSAPTGWPGGASPTDLTTVTDALNNVWRYQHDGNGCVTFTADPLWVDSTHESYNAYTYNGEYQIVTAETPKPNAESGRLTTSYFYNSDNNLAAVQDTYGFVTWFKYGSRASYDTSGTGATIDDVIGVFSLMPNQQAYDDSDHTISETTPPSLSSPLNVDSFVSWDGTNLYWKYTDGSGSPKTIKLVRTVNDYTFATGTGQLTQLLSCSPVNFAESSATSYSLTSASACSKQTFDSTVGDLYRSYTPRQFKDSSLKYTEYTHDQTYGVVTAMEAADSISAAANKKTLYTYNDTKTRVTKTQLPQDNTNQWTETILNSDTMFALKVKKPDIQSWGIDPIVSVSVFDNNGNLTQGWQADPAGTPADWDGNTGGGGYQQVMGYAYDRLNRLIQSDQIVTLSVSPTTLSTYFSYDKNGNRTRVKGPAYLVSATTYYSYTFAEYDADNRLCKAYNMVANTNSNLTSVPGGTPYIQYVYDLMGNVLTLTDPNTNDADYTYDWRRGKILTSQAYTGANSPRETAQHFGANGAQFWSADGLGYMMYPEYDNNGRLTEMHRGGPSGDADLREYDYDGNVQYSYTYKDINTDGGNYRTRNKYDLMDRLVNSGRQLKATSAWGTWNYNLADTEFNYNGWTIKTFDKVNSAGTYFTERTYDDWGQATQTDLPEVLDMGGSPIVYNTQSVYDVLGRLTSSFDANGNSTDYGYDELGRVITVTDALMYNIATEYDARGNKYQVTTAPGAVYQYFYNGRNMIEQVDVIHDSTTDTTTFDYDDNGNRTQVAYPDGGETNTTYDELNRRIATSVLLSGSDYLATTYDYDNNNRILLFSLPGSYTVAITYDDFGNVEQMTDSNGDNTDYSYDLDNRRLTETLPNGMVTTNTYGDWKTRQVSSVLQERNTTSGDDITQNFTYDNDGRQLTHQDGRGNTWTKTWDAMGRQSTLLTPTAGAAYTHYMYYDGNGNMVKTTDFNGNSYYYTYDALNRMDAQGPTNPPTAVTYSWLCCQQLDGYTDAQGTAVLTYDELSRNLSNTDSNGNVVVYEYDSMNRIKKVTPAQGTNYRTEYTYNENGSLAKCKVYDAGTGADTDYSYDSTSGQLLQRNFPASAGSNIRTTYAYDSAGRLEYETQTREAGGTTNLYKTQYAYAYIAAASGGGRSLVRTEQEYVLGSWTNNNKLTYKYNALEWQTYEERHDWVTGAWSNRYDTTQAYDKCGNRTGYDHNIALGTATSYCRAMNLTYSYNSQNRLTGVTDGDEAQYNASVICNANNNITQIVETYSTGFPPTINATLTTDFTYDGLNRMTQHKTTRFDFAQNKNEYTIRNHYYSGTGAIIKSDYTKYLQGNVPTVNSLEHVYAGAIHSQNFDGTSTYGSAWHWAGATNSHGSPVNSPNPDTASQQGYNIANMGGKDTPQRRTWQNPTTQGNERQIFGQGRPMAKSSSGNGANWYQGTISDKTGALLHNVESRFFYEGTVTATDMSRVTDAREAQRIGIFGTSNSYGGSYGRVTNEAIGRDLNPLGRGNSNALVAGDLNLGVISPVLPNNAGAMPANGNSANNWVGPKIDAATCVLMWVASISPVVCNPPGQHICWFADCNWCGDALEAGLDLIDCWLKDPAGVLAKMCNCLGRCGGGACAKCCGIKDYEGGIPACPQHCCGYLGTPIVGPTPVPRNLSGFSRVPGDCQGCGSARSYGSGSKKPPTIMPKLKYSHKDCTAPWASHTNVLQSVFSACFTLLNCNCLPPKSMKCIQDLCSGVGEFILTCKPTCEKKGEVARTTNGGAGCPGQGTPQGIFTTFCEDTISRQKNPASFFVRTLGHEMMHYCDCKIDKPSNEAGEGHRHNPGCYTLNPGGTTPDNPYNEGFAQACENACFGFQPGGYNYPANSSLNASSNWCCLCQTCSK